MAAKLYSASMSQSSVFRLIDANANRAREALRVMEDYARFILNSQPLSAQLKGLRHDLAAALAESLPLAMLHRDTPGDVGTGNKTASELHRQDVQDVVIAAGKRFGEALRALEEYSKTFSPVAAARLEAMRYRFYTVEQSINLSLRPASAFAKVRLYVLISEDYCLGRPWRQVAEQAIRGGADCLQLREKTLEGAELLKRARELVSLCRNAGVVSIINDRVDVALLSDADGVHLGQGDLPAREARRLMGAQKIIGVSTHCIEHARQAVLDGADYIGVGPVYRSATKTREILPGLDYAKQVAGEITIPAVAIAGISAANVGEVLATGLRAVAVTAAVTQQPDIAAAARMLKERLAP